ncbi:arsenate reductase (glutaredoxin) [Apibacter sp. HY039]|uniref:arsenate reductase (glutaredoxin) n=1 Tax=Apibacter sp. HY039 TaxID=2501476 RepID=UPI002104C535|nr:arsenate reductase (glutaredoxin) [Apibacter sp. HY039]
MFIITIYHNPRCSKSREALDFLREKFKEIHIINYMQTGINVDTLKELVNLLQIQPMALVRTNESLWNEQFKDMHLEEIELLEILSKNPQLIQRPVIINGNKAVIGRPKENINLIL